MKRCKGCQKIKEDKAFIGDRDNCRICYHYLSPEEKEKERLCAIKRTSVVYIRRKNDEKSVLRELDKRDRE